MSSNDRLLSLDIHQRRELQTQGQAQGGTASPSGEVTEALTASPPSFTIGSASFKHRRAR